MHCHRHSFYGQHPYYSRTLIAIMTYFEIYTLLQWPGRTLSLTCKCGGVPGHSKSNKSFDAPDDDDDDDDVDAGAPRPDGADPQTE